MKLFLKKIRKHLSRCVFPMTRLCASLLSLFGSLLGKVYKKLWRYSDLASYEHMFDYLSGIKNFYWLERGINGLKPLPIGAKVLDLGCGDGIFSGIFYSTRAKDVEAVDWDPKIITLAKKNYQRPNVVFRQADITKISLQKKYDAVYLFAVIEHFTVAEGQGLVKKISLALNEGGYFMGSTPLFSEKGGHNVEHQNEFSTEQEVKDFVSMAFSHIETWISFWPHGRRECYFLCRLPK